MINLDQSTEFQGGVFSEQIEGGRSAAKISITPQEVIANSSEGNRFSIPFRNLQLDMGGASGRMIFCRNTERTVTIFCEEKGFSKLLDQQSSGLLAEQLRSVAKRQQGYAKTFWFWLTISTVALMLFCFVGYYALIAAAQATLSALPISVDEKIGSVAIKSMDLHGRLEAGHDASRMVEEIVKKLKSHAAIKELNFRVIVVDENIVNAFALPGGQIVVYTGLMKKAKDAEQLAGVLAHEMAHATLRHGLKGVGQSLGIVAAIQILTGDVGGLLAISTHLAQESILTSYSRQSETEADLEGARMLHEAGIDPQKMAEFFTMLKNEEGDIPDMLAWISSHPQHVERVEKIETYKKTLAKKEYQALEVNWEKVREQLE